MKVYENQQEKIQENFGIWLRSTRLRLPGKPTQGDIAKKAGLSRSHYSQIESGSRGTSIDSSGKIARALGILDDPGIASVMKMAGHADITLIPDHVILDFRDGRPPKKIDIKDQIIQAIQDQSTPIRDSLGRTEELLARIARTLEAVLDKLAQSQSGS